jgi:putative component of membrane protein insertase Oxa1/YidC/SpoIIIJ protein YidD
MKLLIMQLSAASCGFIPIRSKYALKRLSNEIIHKCTYSLVCRTSGEDTTFVGSVGGIESI